MFDLLAWLVFMLSSIIAIKVRKVPNLLKWVSERFNKAIRDSDVICRLGGDEFLILFYGASTNKNEYINKITGSVSLPFQPNKKEIGTIDVSLSVGVSIYPDEGKKLDDLIHQADLLMYENKKANA